MSRFTRFFVVALACFAFNASAFALQRAPQSNRAPRTNRSSKVGVIGGRSSLARGDAHRERRLARQGDRMQVSRTANINVGRVVIPSALVQTARTAMGEGVSVRKATSMLSRAARVLDHVLSNKMTATDRRIVRASSRLGALRVFRLNLSSPSDPWQPEIYNFTVTRSGVVTDVRREGLR